MGQSRVVLLKPLITSPLIEVGEFSYYDDPEFADEFETRNVLHHYGPDRLIIGKFCAFAAGTTFIMNGANHRMGGVSTFPFPIMGGAWAAHIDLITDLPSRGGTVVCAEPLGEHRGNRLAHQLSILGRLDGVEGVVQLVVEVFSAVRGRWLGQKITQKRAEDALFAMVTTTIDLVSATPLLPRMWELRNNVSGYDAAYVAVAETFGCALVTADARLASVPDLRCEVRLALPLPKR